MSSSGSLLNVIDAVEPDEIYHLAAQSHVRVSFDVPAYTADITGVGAVRILEAVRKSGVKWHASFGRNSRLLTVCKRRLIGIRGRGWEKRPHPIIKLAARKTAGPA